VGQDGHAQRGRGLVGGIVGDAQLFRHASRGHFQLKKFDEPQPLLGGKVSVVQKTLAEVVKGILTAGAAPVSPVQGVEFPAAAFGAETLMVFPAKFQQKFFC
jgi:hypothetical protein